MPPPETSPERTALAGLIRVLDQQTVMLLDASQRPEVDVASLTKSAFELVLRGARELTSAAASDPSVDAALRHQISELAAHATELEQITRDARVHVHELAAGWKCSSCGLEVPSEPRVAAVAKSLVIDLKCRACGKRTAITEKGRESFERLFGPLAGPTWNAARNGFVVGGRP
ncbi:MAG: hypothetical protein HY791_38840 [Deltaproteobacteria bacterium]|nr:hypothetical protein [Deltaproteobacteria bacterium]